MRTFLRTIAFFTGSMNFPAIVDQRSNCTADVELEAPRDANMRGYKAVALLLFFERLSHPTSPHHSSDSASDAPCPLSQSTWAHSKIVDFDGAAFLLCRSP